MILNNKADLRHNEKVITASQIKMRTARRKSTGEGGAEGDPSPTDGC